MFDLLIDRRWHRWIWMNRRIMLKWSLEKTLFGTGTCRYLTTQRQRFRTDVFFPIAAFFNMRVVELLQWRGARSTVWVAVIIWMIVAIWRRQSTIIFDISYTIKFHLQIWWFTKDARVQRSIIACIRFSISALSEFPYISVSSELLLSRDDWKTCHKALLPTNFYLTSSFMSSTLKNFSRAPGSIASPFQNGGSKKNTRRRFNVVVKIYCLKTGSVSLLRNSCCCHTWLCAGCKEVCIWVSGIKGIDKNDRDMCSSANITSP